MKLTPILFTLLAGIVLCACEKEATVEKPPQVQDPWIKGTINNSYYCISRNDTYNGITGWYNYPDASTHHLVFDREITGTDYIWHMSLSQLRETEYYSDHLISKGKYSEGEESCSLTIRDKDYNTLARYYPSKTPCKITVIKNGDYQLSGADFLTKALVGTINGTLYNTQNPLDSIMVDVEFVIIR